MPSSGLAWIRADVSHAWITVALLAWTPWSDSAMHMFARSISASMDVAAFASDQAALRHKSCAKDLEPRN